MGKGWRYSHIGGYSISVMRNIFKPEMKYRIGEYIRKVLQGYDEPYLFLSTSAYGLGCWLKVIVKIVLPIVALIWFIKHM